MALFKYQRDGTLSENVVSDEDVRNLQKVLSNLKAKHPEWLKYTMADGREGTIGIAYDGRASMFSSKPLPFQSMRDGNPFHEERISAGTGDEPDGREYLITLIFTHSNSYSRDLDFTQLGSDQLRMLDVRFSF